MKLYHAADLHIGRNRLDGRLPDRDLAEAFRFIANAAVADKADLFLIAGDLFDRPQVEPDHLRQAREILQILFEAGIPVVAIEGNHDKAFIHSDDATWVGFLAGDGLLKLLRPRFGPEGAKLSPWNPQTREGAFIDQGGVRFVGAGYLGAATPAKVRQILAALEDPLPHVLLLHAGPDYFVGEGGGFAKEDLEAMRRKLCYLALGHIHKPMVYEGWACNPGSPENCDLREAAYAQGKDGQPLPRGYAVIEIDPAQAGKPTSLEVRSNPRRPILRTELDCTPFGSKIKNGAAALVAAALKTIAALAPQPETVIDLRLTGNLKLNRIALDPLQAALEIEREAKVFAVSIDTTGLNIGDAARPDGSNGNSALSREQVERQAIRQLVGEHSLWGLDDEQETFAELFYGLKEAVSQGRSAEAVTEAIATSPLVEKIRAAKAASTGLAAPAATERPVTP